MSANCTIYSPTIDYEKVVQVVETNFSQATMNLTGDKANWNTIRIDDQRWEFVITSMQREKPGDEFSKLILGTLTLFRDVSTVALENKQKVIDGVTETEWLLGIVAEPDFDESVGHLDCIFEITELLNGMIFNGLGMIDAEGKLILDLEGNFDGE